jgi:seryl-tRNA synthetase
MLDLRYIKEHLDEVKASVKARNMKADPDRVVELYDRRGALILELDAKRRRRNEVAEAMKAKLAPEQRQALIEEGKALKEAIAALEPALEGTEKELRAEAMRVPNLCHPEAPIGKEDKDNLEVKRVGEPTRFDFEPKDHVQLGQDLDIIDFDAATRVTGTKFYYLKNEAVFLEFALVQYALNLLRTKGFTLFITPDLAKEEILEGIGFNPRGSESNIYAVEGTGTCLVGTAEITLGGYYSGQVIPKQNLPLRLAGVSHCFRREAGAAGQFSKGLYRVHQFTKVEMFAYTLPEDSERMHAEMRTIEEEIFASLGLPFRVVDTCTGDLGAPAYRKWDLEAWMPGRNGGEWGEVTSTSNCTDYQARNLDVRYRDDDGKTKHCHMLNGTAIAVSRALIAILENFQRADGSVAIPEVLRPLCGFSEIKR